MYYYSLNILLNDYELLRIYISPITSHVELYTSYAKHYTRDNNFNYLSIYLRYYSPYSRLNRKEAHLKTSQESKYKAVNSWSIL